MAISSGTVGVEFDHMTLQTKDKLQAALPDCRLVDISQVDRDITDIMDMMSGTSGTSRTSGTSGTWTP